MLFNLIQRNKETDSFQIYNKQGKVKGNPLEKISLKSIDLL